MLLVTLRGSIPHLQALAEMLMWREGMLGAAFYLPTQAVDGRASRGPRARPAEPSDQSSPADPAAAPGIVEALTCIASAGDIARSDPAALRAALRAYWGSFGGTDPSGLIASPVARRGDVLGALVLSFSERLSKSEVERRVLRPAARLASVLLAGRTSARGISQQTTLLRALDEVSAAVEQATTDDSVLEAVFAAGVEALRCDTASLFVLDAPQEKLRLVAGKNLPEGTRGRTFRLGEGIAGWAAAHGQTVMVPDVRLDERYQPPDTGLDAPRSLLVVPLRLYGEVIACLSFARRGTSAFAAADRELAERIAVFAAQSIAHARLTKLESQAELIRRRFETLSAVSHDIRSELSQIKLVAKLAQHAEQGEDRDAYLSQLIGKVDWISALLNAGLVTARLETELHRLQSERFGLRRLVESVVEDARQRTQGDRPFEVKVRADIVVKADQLQLRRVLTNLLDNAVRYSPPGRPIRVEADPLEHGVRVSVIDEGRGIAPEEQARIFEPFQRAVGAGDAPGFGLGLYVCWRIVEAHGGRIAVESQPGRGSVFHFVLPREV